jgi:tartrate dehydrogenase/decarboxylase / D-malate dehydrogenase
MTGSGFQGAEVDSEAAETSSSEAALRVALVPGDGIGPEVVEVTLPLLSTAASIEGLEIAFSEFDWGGERYLRTGTAMPPDAVEQVRDFDAVLFGAVGRGDIPADVSVWGLILPLRQALDLYVNLRPVRAWPGIEVAVRDVEGVDFVIVRENSEGEYTGMGGRTHVGTPDEVAVEVAVHSRRAIARVAEYAFALASRRRNLLTVATKSNASRHGYVLWDEVVAGVGSRYPDVEVEYVFVDALAARMIQRPRSLDVVLSSNLFGDILSDLAAPIQAGLGMAPSANIRPEGGVPGVFEPVHGSAPDIAGRGIANPIACVLSVALLLETAGHARAAAALTQAVDLALADPRSHTNDIGGSATTAEAAAAIANALDRVAAEVHSE